MNLPCRYCLTLSACKNQLEKGKNLSCFGQLGFLFYKCEFLKRFCIYENLTWNIENMEIAHKYLTEIS